MQVKVEILNPDLHLRPDMNATVKVSGRRSQAGEYATAGSFCATPLQIHDRDGGEFVFIAFDGKAVSHEVKILSQRSGGVVVQGLNGGEDVITSAPQDLKDGDKIRIKGQS